MSNYTFSSNVIINPGYSLTSNSGITVTTGQTLNVGTSGTTSPLNVYGLITGYNGLTINAGVSSLGTSTPVTVSATGVLTVNNTTTSTSSITGSAIIKGGLGVAENIYSGGTLNNTGAVNLATSSGPTTIGSTTAATISQLGVLTVNNLTSSGSSITGSAIIKGGLGVAENIYSGGTLNNTGAVNLATSSGPTTIGSTTAATISQLGVLTVNNTTTSTSSITGSAIIKGGLGVAENIYSGGTLNNTGVVNLATSSGTTTIGATTAATISQLGVLTVNNTTTSTSSITGSAIIKGGLGVAENIYSGGTLNNTGAVNLATASGPTTIGSTTAATISQLGVLTVNNTTGSTSSITGSAIIKGGLGVAENIYSGGKITITGNTDTFAYTSTVSVGDKYNVSQWVNSSSNSGVNVGQGSLSYMGITDAAVIATTTDKPILLCANNIIQLTVSTSSTTLTTGKTLNVGTSGTTSPLNVYGLITGYNGLTINAGTSSLGTSTPVTVSSTGVLTVNNTTSSTSSITGSAIIKGGLGVAGNIYSGGNITTGTATQNSGGWGFTSSVDTVTYSSTVSVANKFNLSQWNNGGNSSAVYVGQGSSGFTGGIENAAVIITTTDTPILLCPFNTKRLSVSSTSTTLTTGQILNVGTSGTTSPLNVFGLISGANGMGLTGQITLNNTGNVGCIASNSTGTNIFNVINFTNTGDGTVYIGMGSTGYPTNGTQGCALMTTAGLNSTILGTNGIARLIIDSTGIISISNTTASTSNTIGAFKMSGGLSISNTTDAIDITNGGTFTTAGGVAIAKKLYVGGITTLGTSTALTVSTAGVLTVNNTTASTSPTTGAIVSSGGIAGTDVIISNRVSTLGYMYNSTTAGTAVYTGLKALNKRSKCSRATAKKAITATWQSRSTPSIYSEIITWSPELSLFVAAAGSPGQNSLYSSDGITWNTSTVIDTIRTITWSPELNLFVAVSFQTTPNTTNNIYTSSNGTSWSSQTTSSITNCIGGCWSPELSLFVVAVNTSPYILYSSNGTTWSSSGVTLSSPLKYIVWSSELKLFVATGNNFIWRSTDALTWTSSAIAMDDSFGICWSSELYLFVALGKDYTSFNTKAHYSSDGISWTSVFITSSDFVRNIIWVPDLSIFVIGADGAGSAVNVYYSSDGINWQINTCSNDGDGGHVAWSPELSIFALCNSGTDIKTSTPALATNLNTIKGPSSQIYLNPSNGQLGLNQPSPGYLLDVNGTSRFTGISTITNTTDSLGISSGSINTLGGVGITKKLYVGTDTNLATASGVTTIGSTTAATISSAGVLTVNNTTNSSSTTTGSAIIKGGLGVAGNIYSGTIYLTTGVSGNSMLAGKYIDSAGTFTSYATTSGFTASIYATSSIYTGGLIFIGSDLRIKNIETATININNIDNIEPVYYTLKDKIKNGSNKRLGFIAQNVYEYEPDAISKSKEIIPDILKNAIIINELENESCIELINHQLKVNEKIKILIIDNQEQEHEFIVDIVSIINQDIFIINKKLSKENKIFIYGREVNDFHHVDYNQMMVLAFAGVKQLRKENKEILRTLDNLNARLELLEIK